MKQVLKKLLFGDPIIPQWVAVGLRSPQPLVQVWLHGATSRPIDVTHNNTVAALRPFTIAIGWGESQLPPTIGQSPLELVLRERSGDHPLGRIRLRFAQTLRLPGGALTLFETNGYVNFCVSWLRLQQYYLHEWWAGRKSHGGYNFNMARAELHSLLVLYIAPRPVYLVAVAHGAASNLFPMDLVGSVAGGYFLMALRLTSPAVRLIQESRRMTLAYLPAEFTTVAYELGKHHRQESIDLTTLPFAVTQSPTWGLPVPQAALGVREVAVEQTEVVGSHMLFITRVVHEASWRAGLQMHHTPGLYQAYRQAHKRPLTTAY